jgi:hypothetical protein
MISSSRVTFVSLSLCLAVGISGVAGAKKKQGGGSPKQPTASVIDGSWKAKGTVTIARHIADAKVGDTVSRNWTIRSKCANGKCTPTLSYRLPQGNTTRVPLSGGKSSWAGTLGNQTFQCTHGGTATGSLTFKLKVTSFTKHQKRTVASAMTATGTQVGEGCASVKQVVKFKVTRLGF